MRQKSQILELIIRVKPPVLGRTVSEQKMLRAGSKSLKHRSSPAGGANVCEKLLATENVDTVDAEEYRYLREEGEMIP